MDPIVPLARLVIDTAYEDIPSEAIAAAKRLTLDTFGAAIAGTRADGCQEVAGVALDWGGKPEATIIGSGKRVPAPNAAMANGTMMRALELDECHVEAILHSMATIVPAAVAIAERQGNVSGREFLAAIVLAVDLTTRMSLAPRISSVLSGMSFTYQCGTFGAAAAAGRLMGFDESRMLDALGLAYSQTAGNQQCLVGGNLTVRTQQGLSAKAGTLAAILAERGVTGPHEILEGKYGYYKVYHRNEYDRDVLTRDLGKRYEIVNDSIKPFSSCRFTHGGIQATLDLVREYDLNPDNVDEVDVQFSNVTHYTMVSQCVDERGYGRQPKNLVEAQWSMPYVVANAITRRSMFLEAYTGEAMTDPGVNALAARVRPTLSPSAERDTGRSSAYPVVVEITTRDGRRLTKRLDYPPGSPENPLSREELLMKFRNCAAWALQPLSEERINRIVLLVETLDEQENAAVLGAALA